MTIYCSVHPKGLVKSQIELMYNIALVNNPNFFQQGDEDAFGLDMERFSKGEVWMRKSLAPLTRQAERLYEERLTEKDRRDFQYANLRFGINYVREIVDNMVKLGFQLDDNLLTQLLQKATEERERLQT
jgi:hypothetical protein